MLLELVANLFGRFSYILSEKHEMKVNIGDARRISRNIETSFLSATGRECVASKWLTISMTMDGAFFEAHLINFDKDVA